MRHRVINYLDNNFKKIKINKISYIISYHFNKIIHGGSVVNNPPAHIGDMDLISGSCRYSGEGNGNPLQYSCLEHPMDRGAWWAAVHGVTNELDTT